MPILNPLVDTNGSRLAKTIVLPLDPTLSKIFDVESYAEDSWKEKQQSVFAVASVCCF